METSPNAAQEVPRQLPWVSETLEIPGRRKTDAGTDHQVPVFASAFPLAQDATRVHSALVARIGGAWASGAQPYASMHPSDLEWDSKDLDFFDVRYHTAPRLEGVAPRYLGGPHFLVEDRNAAVELASVYCDPRLASLAYKHKNMRLEKLPPWPQKIDRVYVPAGPVKHSGRIFTSRDDALEDAKILAAMMDIGHEPQQRAFWSDLHDARPTPAFDIDAPGKVSLADVTAQTSMVQMAYEAGHASPSLLIAAAAITGGIPAEDPRIGATPSAQHSGVVNDIREGSADLIDAVRATRAGKTLREDLRSTPARVTALQMLELIAVKQGNSQSISKVLGAAEAELSRSSLVQPPAAEMAD